MSWLDKYFTKGVTAIQVAGVAVPAEATVNFVSGATLADDAANARTNVTISGGAPSGAAGGDLSGTYPNPGVAKINATTVTTAGGALTTGTVLRATGAAASDWGAVNLGAAAAVTGVLPIANGGNGNAGAASAIAALSIDWTLAPVYTKTLAAGGNTFTFANQASGMVIIVRLTGAASTVTWPTVKWAGGTPPVQTASGTDIYTFVHDGTSIYGSVVQAMS